MSKQGIIDPLGLMLRVQMLALIGLLLLSGCAGQSEPVESNPLPTETQLIQGLEIMEQSDLTPPTRTPTYPTFQIQKRHGQGAWEESPYHE